MTNTPHAIQPGFSQHLRDSFGHDFGDVFTAIRREQNDDRRFARLEDATPADAHQTRTTPETPIRQVVALAAHNNNAGFFADIIGDPEDNRPLQQRAPYALRLPLQAFLTQAHERGAVDEAQAVLDWITAAARPNFNLVVGKDPRLATVRASLTMGPNAYREPATVKVAKEASAGPQTRDGWRARYGTLSAGFARRDQLLREAASKPTEGTAPQQVSAPRQYPRARGQARVVRPASTAPKQQVFATFRRPLATPVDVAGVTPPAATSVPRNRRDSQRPSVPSHRPPTVRQRIAGLAKKAKERLTLRG